MISDERLREETMMAMSACAKQTMMAMNEVAAPHISLGRALAVVVIGLTVTGALVGALWAWLAPPIHGVVALTKSGDRIKAYLGNEADHFFISAVPLVGMLAVLAVVAARADLAVACPPGTGDGRRAGDRCGPRRGGRGGCRRALVRVRYGTIDIAGAPVSPEHRVHYVIEAPAVFFGHSPLQIAATMLFPAAVAALVYALWRCRPRATISAPGRRSNSRCYWPAPSQRSDALPVRPVTTFAAIFRQPRHAP